MDKSVVAYGHTFQNDKARNAYAKMKSESRARALARKKSMNTEEKDREAVRKHFKNEAKHFNIK